MTPDERWARLSAAAAVYMNASDAAAVEAGRHVIWLARELSDYVGSPERGGRVLFYALEIASTGPPEFRRAHTGWAAVSPASDGFWQFGLGLELERAPRVYPRLVICWPMRIRPGSGLTVQIGANEPLEISPDKGGEFDLGPLCERMFRLSVAAVERGSKGEGLPPGFAILVDQ